MYDNRLLQWRDNIGAFLDITKTEVMLPIFRRQHTVLHLAHSHAIIMLHRQALLAKPSAFTMRPENTAQADLQYSIQRCLGAATNIVTMLRRLVESQQMYSAFWVSVPCRPEDILFEKHADSTNSLLIIMYSPRSSLCIYTSCRAARKKVQIGSRISTWHGRVYTISRPAQQKLHTRKGMSLFSQNFTTKP